jgi:hypothetical protein
MEKSNRCALGKRREIQAVAVMDRFQLGITPHDLGKVRSCWTSVDLPGGTVKDRSPTELFTVAVQ